MNKDLILELISNEILNCYEQQREYNHDLSERIKELKQCYDAIVNLK